MESQEFLEAQKAVRGIGPPAPHNMVALLEGLSQMDIGRGGKEAIAAFLETWKTQAPQGVEVCRLEPAYQEGKIKIVWSCPTNETLNQVIINCFKAWGEEAGSAHIPVGVAPPRYLEEELSEWISDLIED